MERYLIFVETKEPLNEGKQPFVEKKAFLIGFSLNLCKKLLL